MKASTRKADARPFTLDEIATAVLDSRGTVLGWSSAAAELLDRAAAEVCGKPLGRLLADTSDRRCWDKTTSSGMPAAGRAALRHRSGNEVEVAFRVLPLEGCSGFLLLAAPTHCVTDWEQGAALLRALLKQDQIGISIHDADLRPVRTNITAEAFGADAVLRRVLATGVPLVEHEQRMRSPQVSGRQGDFSLSAVRLEDSQGRPAGVAALCTEATRQRQVRRDLELLHQASARIGHSLDVKRTVQDLVDVLVPALGDMASASLAEAVFDGDEPSRVIGGGELHMRRAAVASATGPWPAALLQPGAKLPPLPDMPNLRSVQHGGAVIADRGATADAYRDPELIRLLFPEHGHSVLWAPLFARGLLLGAVGVWRTEKSDPFQQDDADLLTEIASRAALSVDNARRYTREHRANIALQQRLLPQSTTDTPAAETAGLYQPAGGGAEISGGWFDVLPLPSLRVAFVVGDVVGHGLHATATMGRLRTAIRTLADLELEPDELLIHLDDVVARLAAETGTNGRDAIGATCLYALYDPRTRRCTLASAGHPPPIWVRPDGTCHRVELSPGPPLGVGGMPFEPTTMQMDPDSILALYTDGLIERDDRDPEAGLLYLTDRLAAHCHQSHSLDAIGRAVLADAAGPPPHDDIALLLARTRALAPDDSAAWEFPADPAAVADARQAATRQLATWGLDEAAFITELVVSELVTNAIRYAGGPVGLRLIRDTGVLVCEVTDPGNTQPRLCRARTTDEGGRGLFLVAQLTQRWGSRYSQSGKTIWAEQLLPAAPTT